MTRRIARLLLPTAVLAAACAAATAAAPPAPPPGPEVATGFIDVHGASLYYEVAGAGPALVLIHGGHLDGRMWDDVFPDLARDHRVVRYDVRCNGRSSCPDRPHCDYEDLVALMDSLGVGTAELVGFSMGARIAVDAALEHPERVSALAAVAPGIGGYHFTRYLRGPAARAMMDAGQSSDWAGVVNAYMSGWVDGPFRSPRDMDQEVRARIRTMLAAGFGSDREGGPNAEAEPPALGRLTRIAAPTLAVVGELDQPDIHTICDLMVDQIDGARKEVVPDCAHMIPLERPDAFLELLRRFLGEVEADATDRP